MSHLIHYKDESLLKPETYPGGHSATQNSSYIKGLPGQVRQTAPGRVEIAKY